jgi:hypothetical protein
VRSVSYGRTEKEAQALLNAFGELIYYLSSPITFSPAAVFAGDQTEASFGGLLFDGRKLGS